MSTQNPLVHLVTEDEKRGAMKGCLRKMATRLGVNPDLLDRKITFGPTGSGLSPEQEHELAKAKGLQASFQALDEMLTQIKTQEELDRLLEGFAEMIEKLPTIARAQMDLIKKKMVRRGGPGRVSKLDRSESTIVCREILKHVGMKKTIKKALEEVSGRCPDLLQKSVSPRTLQKAWDKRDVYLSDLKKP